MAETVTVVLPVTASVGASIITGHVPTVRKMTIQTTTGSLKVVVPFAPQEISYDNWGINWAQVPRDGRVPYLIRESSSLPTISFTITLANSRSQDASQHGPLWQFKAMSDSILPIKITYGGGLFESGFLWRLTKFSFKSTQRNPSNSAISQAEVDLEFTVIQDIVLSTGPTTGGVKPPVVKKPPTKKPVKKPANIKYKTYTVKKGDTLISIAIKLYKNASKWRYLADTNKIKNHKIKPGQKLKY